MSAPQPWLWGRFTASGLIAAALAAVIDQGFKLWMIFGFDITAHQPVQVGPFLKLVMAWNYGISYGLFEQQGDLGQWVLVGIKALAIALFWVWLARAETRIGAVALGLIIGGAIGNGIDRATYGAVADFFLVEVPQWDFRWYIFNLADVAIVAGVIGLLYEAVLPRRAPETP
jgi:signal peptidase II